MPISIAKTTKTNPKSKRQPQGYSWRSAMLIIALLTTHMSSAQQAKNTIDSLTRVLENTRGASEQAELYLHLGYQYVRLDSLSRSQAAFMHALHLAEESGNEDHMASACYQLGELYYRMDDYINAQRFYIKGYQIAERIHHHELMIYCSAGLGSVYVFNNNYTSALKHIHRAINLAKKHKFTEDIPKLLNLVGVTYLYKNELDSALHYYRQLLAAGRELNDSILIGCAYNNMADAYIAAGNYKEAIELLDQSYQISMVQKQMKAVSTILSNKGESLMKLGRYQEALEALTECLSLTRKHGFLSTEMKVSQNLSILYEKMGDTENAFKYYKQYTISKDSIYDIKKQQQIHRLETQNQIEQAEKQFELYKQKAYTRSIFLYFAIILSILLVFSFLQYRKKIKLRLALQEAEKLQMEGTIDHKNREMASMALNLEQKQQLVSLVEESVKKATNPVGNTDIEALMQEISVKIKTDNYLETHWSSFLKHFSEVHPTFFKSLEEKHPDLSVNDLRQCAYIKMNLRSNEVAFINNINKKSVYMIRYRLKHKLGLNPSDDIKAYLDHFE